MRTRVVLACFMLAGAAVPRASMQPARQQGTPPLVAPRVVSASVDGIAPARVDLAVRVAVRTARDVTVRSVSFNDSSVHHVPVWIAPMEGSWALRGGEEAVLPQPLRVSVHARDLLHAEDLGSILGRKTVSIRTTIEVGFATPWPARLLMLGPTQTALTEAEIDVPLVESAALRPLAGAAGAALRIVHDGVAPVVLAAQNRLPARQEILERFGGRVAPVTTTYTIGHERRARVQRTVRTLGFWWSDAVFCTTREAFEPWRFDASDASVLQLGGGRLLADDAFTRIGAATNAPAVQLRTQDVSRRLPKAKERRLHTPLEGTLRRVRLIDREDAASVACLRLANGVSSSASAAVDPAAEPSGTFAAFGAGRTLAIIWTDIAAAEDYALRLTTRVHLSSYGSPLVSSRGVSGMVVSASSALRGDVVAAAASKAVLVSAHPVSAEGAR